MANSFLPQSVNWLERRVGIEDHVKHRARIRDVGPPSNPIYRHFSKRERLEACATFLSVLRNKGADYRGMVQIRKQKVSPWDLLIGEIVPFEDYDPLIGVEYANRFCNLAVQYRTAMVDDLCDNDYIRAGTADVRADMVEWKARMKHTLDPDGEARSFFARVFGVNLPAAPLTDQPEKVVKPTYEDTQRYKELRSVGRIK